MSHPPLSPEERFAELVEALLGLKGVTHSSDGSHSKKGFGSSGLKVHGRIFAMVSRGRLVVKIPRQRVEALTASGDGRRFDPGHGRLMKEWLYLEPTSEEEWLPLAKEAMDFVASKE